MMQGDWLVWNSLPTEFRDLPVGRVLCALFARYQCIQCSRDVRVMLHYINFQYLSVCLSIYLYQSSNVACYL